MGGSTVRKLAAVLAVAVLAGPSLAKPPPPPVSSTAPALSPAAQQIDDVERAFAQVVAQSGIAAGFRQFAAPDALMFMPDPVPAGPQLAGARWPGELLWRPQFIGVAPSGDLAFSAGPSLLRGPGRPSGGFYLAVWRRQADGAWRFVIDHAVDMPPSIWGGQPRPPVVMVAEPPPGAPPNEGMREADGALNAALPKGAETAFAARLDEEAMVVRDRWPVAQGRRKALALVAEAPPILEAVTLGGSRSMDGSFGYTWGRARWSGPGGPQPGFYVRIWRATPGGWRLLADHLAER